MNNFPKDCWNKHCEHFHVRDLSIDDLCCTCDLLQAECDACNEDFCYLICPKPEPEIEKITHAAIKYRLKGETKFEYVWGINHASCISQFGIMDLYPNMRDMDVEEQGFTTSTGRFVNRIEAKEIALKAKQIPAAAKLMGITYKEYIKLRKLK